MVLPPPSAVGQELWQGLTQGNPPPYLLAAWASFRRILIGFGLSLLLGTFIGIASGRNPLVGDTLGTMIVALQSIPSIAWLPLALIWFGLTDRAIIFMVLIGSTLPIAIQVENGVKSIPPILLRAAQTLGAQGFKMFRYVTLPAVFPSLISGARTAWAFAWRSLMAAELIIATVGLGQVLMLGRETLNMAQVIAVMMIIGFLGYVMDNLVFRWMEENIRQKWGLAGK